MERKRRLEAVADVVVAAQVVAAEDGRRKTARMGAEAARTRAGGLHRVGVYDEKRGRKAGSGWEAGDVRRLRVGGTMDGSSGAPFGLRGNGPCKADGTPDMRYRANRGGGDVRELSGGGGRGGGGGGGPSAPPPPPPPPPSPSRAGRATKRRITTSRWQPYALGKMKAAWRGDVT